MRGTLLRISLRLKLIAPLLAGLLLVEGVAWVSADRASDRLVEERAGSDLQSLVAQVASNVEAAFGKGDSALLELAAARSSGLDDAGLRLWLGALSRSPFEATALHRPDGRSITWFANGIEGASEPDAGFLAPLFLNATYGRPAHRLDTAAEPTLVTVLPLRDPDGSHGGFLSASVRFERLAPSFPDVNYAAAGFAYFAAADGKVVYAPTSPAMAEEVGLPVREGFVESGAAPWLVAAAPAGSGYVVFAVAKAQVTAQLDAMGSALLVAIGATSLLLLGAVAIIVNRTLRPIIRIVPAASRVKEGDFSVRVRHASDDEMGRLAESFNSMVESLETRDRQLTAYARDLKRSSEDFQTAIDTLSSAIASTLNASDVMEVACRECVRILEIDAAYLFLAKDRGGTEHVLAARAPGTAPEILEGADAGGATLVDDVFETATYKLFNRFTMSTVRFPRGLGAGVKSALAVPLSLDGKVQGCLLLLDTVSPIRFTEADVPKATIFAQQVAVAIRNSRFFETAEVERRKYQAVVENANDGILVRAGDEVVFANAAFRRMLGVDTFPMPVEDFLARHIHPDELPKIHERYERRMHGDVTDMRYETRFVAADGHVVPVEISARVIAYDGRLASQMFIRDLTDSKKNQEELAKRTELLLAAEKLAAIGSLAAGVAHEINNPLAFIKGNEQLSQDLLRDIVADPAVPDHVRALAKEIDDSIGVNLTGIHRIERIVSSLRQFAKPSPEKLEVDVNGVIEGTLILSTNKTKARVQIEKDLAASLPTVLGNPDELGQVLLNLVLNAVDATPESGGVLGIRSFVANGHVVVEVSDNGAGIPPEVQRRIFDPFYTTKKHGTGLGLSISHRIVTDHGGALEFRTAPGQGTTFSMRLPIPAKIKTAATAMQGA